MSGQGESSAALKRLTLGAAVLLTASAVGGVGYGLRWAQDAPGMNGWGGWLVAAASLAVGLSSVLVWVNAVRVLRGRPSAGWRVYDRLRITALAMGGIGFWGLLVPGFVQKAAGPMVAFGVVAGLVVVFLVVVAVLKRVLLRDRVLAR